MKILSLLLSTAAIALSFPACATTAKKDQCCAAKTDECCADKKCPPSQCAAPGHAHGKKKGS